MVYLLFYMLGISTGLFITLLIYKFVEAKQKRTLDLLDKISNKEL